MIKLSQTSKMPCKSLGVPIDKTCSGMLDKQGIIKEICEKCYGEKGAYLWPNSVNHKEHNYQEMHKEEFVPDMIKLLLPMDYFRWFDIGDVENETILESIYTICSETPNTQHWIPTKCRDLFDNELWKALESLPNVTVRFSSPSKKGVYTLGLHQSVAISDKSQLTSDLFLCRAKSIGFKKNGKPQPKKCHNCRACWHNNKIIAYELH